MSYQGQFDPTGATRVTVSDTGLPLPTGASTSALQLPDNHNVAVSNFPATQPISAAALPLPTGAATAANQLADNHQVQVSNFPATQPVSAASLPLPAGAATAANQLPDNHNVNVSNFPATQPVSAVSLPLPAGAATAANQLPAGHTITIGDGPNLDAFSRLRICEPQQLFQTQIQYDLDTIDMESGATGTGVAPAYVPNVRVAELSATAGTGTSYTQSYQYIQYQPGKSQLIFATFIFGTGVANVTKDVGYFDMENGVILRQNGTSGLQVILRTSTSGSVVEQVIDQANFNIDVLDGTGPSGDTFNELNSQILIIDLQYLGHGRVRVGVDINGTISYFHQFLNANEIPVPYMQSAALPIQALLTATASAGPATFRFKCAAVVSEGGATNVPTSLSATPSATIAVASGSRTHAMSIRPKLLFNGSTNRSSGLVEGIYLLNTTNTEVFYEIVHGASFSVAPTFNDVNTNFSAYEYGTGGTFANLTNGIVVDSGYLVGAKDGSTGGTSFQEYLPITLDRAGAHRDMGTWTILMTGLGGGSTCYVSLRIREFR